MTLQQALDLLHIIREDFEHVTPFLCDNNKKDKDGNIIYFLGVYKGMDRSNHWIVTSLWDYEKFLKLFNIFSK